MAKEWGREPWELEAEAPAVWVDRWLADKEARAEKAKRDSRSSGNKPGVMELI